MSDANLEELHAFAQRLGLPRRSFDLDHYDIAETNYERAIANGARAVTGHELVRALHASGLRIRQADRGRMKFVRRREFLQASWALLGDRLEVAAPDQWVEVGENLLHRWNEPHRSYHDLQHLEDVLLALDQLAKAGEEIEPVTLLAAWFHDAVYEGQAGEDERASADLVPALLSPLGLPASLLDKAHAFIVATIPGAEVADPPRALEQLLDADLAIFAAGESRYLAYTRAVRAEYSHVSDSDFRRGRAQILQTYLDRPRIYRLEIAAAIWEARARHNLAAEIQRLIAP